MWRRNPTFFFYTILFHVIVTGLTYENKNSPHYLKDIPKSLTAADLTEQRWSRSKREKASSALRIGAILDPLDHATEQALKTGIQVANLLMQKDEKQPEFILKPEIVWIPKEKLHNVTNEVCQLLQLGVVGLISPSDLQLRQAVKMISVQFGIPLIEIHGNSEQNMSPVTLNVHPDNSAFGLALLEYFADYEKWNRFVIILTNYESLSRYSSLLNSFEGIILVRTWGDEPRRWKEIIFELSATDERNFILDIPYWFAKDFLALAFLHNMTGEQYHYVLTNWDIHLLDLSAFSVDCGAKLTTISIVPNIGVNDQYVLGRFAELLRMKINKIERAQRSVDLRPFLTTAASLAYDAMLLFGPAVISQVRSGNAKPESLSCESDGIVWPYGESLVTAAKSLSSIEFPTITGDVLFDSSGQRSNFNMSILRWYGSNFRQIGLWNKVDGLRMTDDVKITSKKQKKQMTALTLRVTTLPDAPFVIPLKFDAYGQPLKSPDAWMGYCVDLLTLISQDVGFNFTIQVAKDKNYGSLRTTSSGVQYYDGMVGEVLRGEADMAVAGLTITYDREKVLDFSTPFMNLGGSLLFTRPKSQKPSIFSFLQPLSPTVWAYVITMYVVVSLGLFVVARLSPYEWQNPHPCEAFSEEKENQFTILSSFWFFISPLLNQGTEMAPHAISTRLLTGIWWFFALIIISTYTANLAAFLTVDTTASTINSVEDLVAQKKVKYGTLKSGSSHDFFKTSKITVFQKMWNFMSANPDVFVANTQEGISRVLNGDYVFVLESTWNEYYNQRNCRLMQIGGLLDSKGYGIGLPQGSPYRDEISQTILKLQKSQQLDNLKRKWWMEFNISEPCTNVKDAGKEASPLDIEQVGGVFVLLLIGFFWAFIVSIIEFCVHNKACRRKQKTIFLDMWKELKFAMRCMTSSTRTKPPSEEKLPEMDVDCNEAIIATASVLAAVPATMIASQSNEKQQNSKTQSIPVLQTSSSASTIVRDEKLSQASIEVDSTEASDFTSDTCPEVFNESAINFDAYPQSGDLWLNRNMTEATPMAARKSKRSNTRINNEDFNWLRYEQSEL